MVGGDGAFDERILDVALDRMLRTGIREASVEEVARYAGLAEADVLERFPVLEELIDAVLSREVQRMLAEVTAVSVTTNGIDAQIESVSLHILWRIRSHPLVTRLLEVTPGETMGYYTVRGGRLVAMGSRYIAAIIEHAQRAGLIARYDPQPAAEMLARLAHSLMLVPDGGTDFRDGARVHAFVLDTIVPLIKYGLPTLEMDHAGDRGQ